MEKPRMLDGVEYEPLVELSGIYFADRSRNEFDSDRFKRVFCEGWEKFLPEYREKMESYWRECHFYGDSGILFTVEIHELNLDWYHDEPGSHAVARMVASGRRIEFWRKWINGLSDEHLGTLIAHMLAHVYLEARDENDKRLQLPHGDEELEFVELLRQLGFDEVAFEMSAPNFTGELDGSYAPGLLDMLNCIDSFNFFRDYGIVDNFVFTRASKRVVFPLFLFIRKAFQLEMDNKTLLKLASETVNYLMDKLDCEYGCEINRAYDSGDITHLELPEEWTKDAFDHDFDKIISIQELLYP